MRTQVSDAVRTSVLTMLTANEWWPAVFCAFVVMGLIFNAFGLALAVLTYMAGLAFDFALAGTGLWFGAVSILVFFFWQAQPNRKHRR